MTKKEARRRIYLTGCCGGPYHAKTRLPELGGYAYIAVEGYRTGLALVRALREVAYPGYYTPIYPIRVSGDHHRGEPLSRPAYKELRQPGIL